MLHSLSSKCTTLTSSTLPKPPTPRVAMMVRSANSTSWDNVLMDISSPQHLSTIACPHLELLALLRLELPRALALLLPGGRVAVLLGAQLLYVPHQLEK